jgi:excisionase family DNA binding protein
MGRDDSPQSMGKERTIGLTQSEPSAGQPAKKAVKIKEAAMLLGICENSVRRLIDRQQLRTNRVLRHHLIPMEEIDRFLSRRGTN